MCLKAGYYTHGQFTGTPLYAKLAFKCSSTHSLLAGPSPDFPTAPQPPRMFDSHGRAKLAAEVLPTHQQKRTANHFAGPLGFRTQNLTVRLNLLLLSLLSQHPHPPTHRSVLSITPSDSDKDIINAIKTFLFLRHWSAVIKYCVNTSEWSGSDTLQIPVLYPD